MFIHSDQIKLYFKTKTELNRSNYVQNSMQDNWEKWCSKRYSCNTTDMSGVADINQ